MLVVSSSVGMLDGVHGNSTDAGPLVPLHAVLVEGGSSLEEGLVGTSSSGDNADLAPGVRRDRLLSSGREAKTGSSLVLVVGDDDGVVSGALGELSAVSPLGLNVADDGSLRNSVKRKDISDDKGGLLSSVDELSGVHALSGDEELVVLSVLVGVVELDLGEGGSTSGVMDDVLHDTTDVTLPLGVVVHTELGGTLTGPGVGAENSSLTFTASSNDLSHFWSVGRGGIEGGAWCKMAQR